MPRRPGGKVILLINPNSNAKTTASMAEIAATATGGVAVEGKSNEGVPPLLTTPKDLADAVPGVVKIGVAGAADDRVGAIIVAAFGDPGLDELRAAVDLPVFGIREQAYREAAKDGRPFGIATTTPDPGWLKPSARPRWRSATASSSAAPAQRRATRTS